MFLVSVGQAEADGLVTKWRDVVNCFVPEIHIWDELNMDEKVHGPWHAHMMSS